jgi:hypothetical protein
VVRGGSGVTVDGIVVVLGMAVPVVVTTPRPEARRFADGSCEVAEPVSGRGRFGVSARMISRARCFLSACLGVRGGASWEVDGTCLLDNPGV